MTPEQLEELSFRNLVEFNKDELIKIMNGARATGLFTEHQRGLLIKYGVISQGAKNKRTKPTARAHEILVRVQQTLKQSET